MELPKVPVEKKKTLKVIKKVVLDQ